MAASLATASELPTTSRRNSGRYFSIQGASNAPAANGAAAGVEENEEDIDVILMILNIQYTYAKNIFART